MNKLIEELSERCWEVRTYGPPWFDYKKFARLVSEECVNACDKLGENYECIRIGAQDFRYKNQLAEGEAACTTLARDIRHLFE